jgi:hypothetical protein
VIPIELTEKFIGFVDTMGFKSLISARRRGFTLFHIGRYLGGAIRQAPWRSRPAAP